MADTALSAKEHAIAFATAYTAKGDQTGLKKALRRSMK